MHSVLNTKYAKLGSRRLLRSFENLCVTCRKRKASTILPIMFDLNDERLGYKQPPFDYTDVVYFGPLYVPVRRSTEIKGNFFSLASTLGLYTLSLCYLWTLVLVSWALNGPLLVVVHQPRSFELVRSVKRVFYDLLGSRRLTEEVLGTTLCLVEQALNSRPLKPR